MESSNRYQQSIASQPEANIACGAAIIHSSAIEAELANVSCMQNHGHYHLSSRGNVSSHRTMQHRGASTLTLGKIKAAIL